MNHNPVFCLAMLAVTCLTEASVVVNGDFEYPDASGTPTYYAGDSFGGWTVASGDINHVDNDVVRRPWPGWQAASGSQSVDLTGQQAGAIYQDLATATQCYALSFFMAGNPNGSPSVKTMEVWWGATLVDTVSFNTTGHSISSMGWSYHAYTVAAHSPSTRLKFKSLTGGVYGPALDDIEVRPIVISISPGTPWITDNRTGDPLPVGHDRKQYFKGQTIRFPFKIRNDGTTNVNAKVYLIPAQKTGNSTHGGPWVVAPQTVTLNASSETPMSFDVPVPANAEFGFYDVKAIVELASDSSIVLDTTEEGANNTDRDAEEAWIGDVPTPLPSVTPNVAWWPQKSFQICQGNPVFLVHGITGNTGSFGDMRALLTQLDNLAVENFDYSAMTSGQATPWTIEQIAGAFAGSLNGASYSQSIPWLKDYYNLPLPGQQAAKVDVVAHSMGGLVTRAYMAGLAQTDTGAAIPYGGEIARVVTLGSPLCGRGGWTIVGYNNENYPSVQLYQMTLGSRFMWNLNTAVWATGQGELVTHFAISSDAVDYINGAFGGLGDGVVDDWSGFGQRLTNRTLARTVGWPYTHIAAQLTKGIASPFNADFAQHVPFRMVRDYLVDGVLNTPLDRASAHDYLNNPIMIKVVDSAGQPINGLSIRTSTVASFSQADPGSGIYAAVVPDENYTITISATGWRERLYKPKAPFGMNHAYSGSLEVHGYTLEDAVDSDSDGWPDHYEDKYPKATSGGPGSLSADTDGDGFSNKFEMYLGTNPEDGSSKLSHSDWTAAPTPDGMEVIIPLETVPGVIYRFQWAPNLSGSWETVETFVGDGSEHQFKRSGIVTTGAFFRFNVELP